MNTLIARKDKYIAADDIILIIEILCHPANSLTAIRMEVNIMVIIKLKTTIHREFRIERCKQSLFVPPHNKKQL